MGTGFIKRIIITGFLVLVAALFYSQIIKGSYYLNKARNNYIKIVPLYAMRGSFYDRNGVCIARDRPTFNVAVIPYQIRTEKDLLFAELADFLKTGEKPFHALYKKNFLNVFSPVDIVVDLKKEDALKVKDKFKDRVVIRALPRRSYPYPYEFSHILGYVKAEQMSYKDIKEYGYSPFERVGKSGLELFYNTYLKGEDGADLVEVDSRGRVVGYLGTKDTVKGRDLTLTIDSRMQKAAYEAMGDWKGAFICLDPFSGEVLAFVSQPSFDLNAFVSGKGVGSFLLDQQKPLLNRGIQARYPPGSVFKAMMALAGLEEGVAIPSTTFNCTGAVRIGGGTFRCLHVHGALNMYQAIARSCNVYFYNLGLKLKENLIAKWSKRFHLDRLSGIDLPYEKEGLVPDRNWKKRLYKTDWFAGDTANFSIGQGYLEITPLRAALLMAAFANGGEIVHPYLASSLEGDLIPHLGPEPVKISGENLEVVRTGMRQAVSSEHGTARLLQHLRLDIAGKTGTAQNSRGKNHGWFAGFFPYGRPSCAFCVFLENAGSSYEAVKVMDDFIARLKEDGVL